jgi:phosphoglycolate phosphatase
MKRAIILDLDGPVLDGKRRHYQCYKDILLEQGHAPIAIETYWEMKRNRIDRYEMLGLSDAESFYDDFLTTWMDRIEEKKYLSLDRLQIGAIRKLQNWKAAGVTLILATLRNNEDNLNWQLSALKLLPLLDKIIAVGTGTKEINMDKAKAVVRYIEQINRDNVLWVGDTEVDILAARALDVKVCAVGCGLRTLEYLATLKPDFLVPGLCSITQI